MKSFLVELARQHRLGGAAILPGAAAIEMAVAAVERAFDAQARELRNITFLEPLVLGSRAELPIRLHLDPLEGRSERGYRFRLTSSSTNNGSAGSSWSEHVTLTIASSEPLSGSHPSVDLSLLQARASEELSTESVYAWFRERGLDYGPGLRTLRRIRRAESEAVVELRLAPEEVEEGRARRLHPALLDGALQSLGCLAVGRETNGARYVPFAIDRVTIYGPLGSGCYCHARVEDRHLGPDGARGELVLFDERGRVLVEISGVRFRKLSAVRERSTSDEARGALHRLVWHEQPFEARGGLLSGDWLVLEPVAETGRSLAEALRSRGARVTRARGGASFRRVEPGLYEIPVGEGAAYDRLLDALEQDGRFPLAGCVLLSGPGEEELSESSDLPARLSLAVGSLFRLGQALSRRTSRLSGRLLVVSAGAQRVGSDDEVTRPDGAALWGLVRTLSLENPALRCQSLDLPGHGALGPNEVESIVGELEAPSPPPEVALRNGRRYVPNLTAHATSSSPDGIRLKRGGRYLITGGLGGLGLQLARWLAGKWEARLVLVGRTLPPEDAAPIRSLASASRELMLCRADVANSDQMRGVMQQVRARLGGVDGVFHLAGVLSDGLLRTKDESRFFHVLRPKVLGAWVLHEVARPSDFLVLFGSAVSLSGNVGQGDYAAANRFLHSFASWRNARGSRTLTIDWGPWSEVGMAAALADKSRAFGIEPFTPEEGLDVLEAALSTDVSQVAAVRFTPGSPWLRSSSSGPPAVAPDAPGRTVSAKASRRDIEDLLLREISGFLEVDPQNFDPETSFLEFGIDSILGAQLLRRLEEETGLELPPTLLFDLPNVRSLAGHLSERMESRPVEPPQTRRVPAVERAPSSTATPGVENRRKRAPASSREISPGDVAVIGLAARFPGAASVDEFWRGQERGESFVGPIPPERFEADRYYDPDPSTPGKSASRWGGFVDGIDQFDPSFFGLSPAEASVMDPQQRLVLEVCWEAVEAAGHAGRRITGSRTGVFVAAGASQYVSRLHRSTRLPAQAATGNAMSILANRISYFLDVKGPSLSVDTACSSSLVALHLAVSSLRLRESALALVAGVHLLLEPEMFVAFSKARMLATEPRCRLFDEHGTGYLRGEGAGALLLKPLEAALADRDPIHGVIRATAVNQDGRTNGIVAPSATAQEAVIREAWERAGVDPASLSYIEIQGTGNPFADAVELRALSGAFRGYTVPRQRCALGTVKPSIGHLEIASGMASLIRVLLSFRHGAIPPTLGLESPQRDVHLEETPFYVNDRLRPWPGVDVRRAGVSSFGFGGTNAHVVLEEPPVPARDEAVDERGTHLLVLSARSETALRELASRYRTSLGASPELPSGDVAYTSLTGRRYFQHRLAIAAGSTSEMQTELTRFRRGEAGAYVAGTAKRGFAPKVAFVFTGQGAQYPGMGRELFRSVPEVRQKLERADEVCRELLGTSLLSVMHGEECASARLGETAWTQPALFALEVALAELWEKCGVHADALLGHSIGEYAAACLAGVFDFETGLRLVVERGRLLGELPSGGGMASVLAEEALVRDGLVAYRDRLWVAAINGPEHVVIAGELDALDEALTHFRSRQIAARRLDVSHAFHSPLVEPALESFAATLEAARFSPPARKLVSNVSGQLHPLGAALDVSYWLRHLREPVRFAAGVETLLKHEVDCLVEVGPHPTLLGLSRRIVPAERRPRIRFLPTLRRGTSDWRVLLESAAQLFSLGIDLEGEELERGFRRSRVVLPTYPFERRRCWVERPAETAAASKPVEDRVAAPRAAELESVLTSTVSRLLGVASSEIDREAPLEELGLDSLMALELKAELEGRLRTEIRFDELGERPSIASLVGRLPGTTGSESPELPASGPAVAKSSSYERFARPAVARRLLAVALDKSYRWAQGDEMAYEEEGETKRVLDLVGGYGSTLLGHNPPELVAEAERFLGERAPHHAQGSVRAAAGRLAEALSRKLERSTGRSYVVHLSSTGAEAVEAAIQHAELEYVENRRVEARERERDHALLLHDGLREMLTPPVREQLEHLLGAPLPEDDFELIRRIEARNDEALSPPPVYLALGRAFHGKTSGAVVLTANEDYRTPYRKLGLPVVRVEDDPESLRAIVEQQALSVRWLARTAAGELVLRERRQARVAALFLEPIRGEGGVLPLPPALVEEVRRLAEAHRFPVVVDEIQTGFGRTGAFTASERLDLRGDYYLLGKSLGGGITKISALAIDEARYVTRFGTIQTSTFGEGELEARVGLKALEIYDRDHVAARAEQVGRRLLEVLQPLRETYPDVIAEVRGVGCLLGVELRPPTSSRLLAAAGSHLGHLVSGYLLNQERIRVLPTSSSPRTLRLEPSAYLERSQVERVGRAFERMCRIMRASNAGALLRPLLTGRPDEDEVESFASVAGEEPEPRVSGVAPVRVAFLTYFTEATDLHFWDPSLQGLPPGSAQVLLERFHRVAEPQLFGTYRIDSPRGGSVEFRMLGLMLSSAMIEERMRAGDSDWLRAKLDAAVDAAWDDGCRVVGLGGFLSIVSHNGRKLATSRLSLTTGNALTVATGLTSLRQGCRRQRIDLAGARVAAIGAAGNICSTYVRLLARDAARFVLVGRTGSAGRLREVASQLYADAHERYETEPSSGGLTAALQTTRSFRSVPPHLEGKERGRWLYAALEEELRDEAFVQVVEDLSALREANVVVTASNASAPVIEPEHLADGPVVIEDLAVPPDVSPAVAELRPDVLVLSGGVVALPPQSKALDICRGHLPPGQVYACMAETMLLGLSGHEGHFSFGEIEPHQVERIQALADEHAFRVAGLPEDDPVR